MTLGETAPGARRAAPGAFLFLLAACATRAPRTADELERRLCADAVTDVRTGRFELTSPYDAAATADYVRVVGEELDCVEALFGDPGAAPVRVHLVPLAAADTDLRDPDLGALFPSLGGLAGGTIDYSFVCVYVAAPGDDFGTVLGPTMRRDTIRHELTHYVAHRHGLDRATWFDEALAREAEAFTFDDGRLREPSFSRALVIARNTARPGTVAELLAWREDDDLTPDARVLRYDQAQALLRFLVARTPDGAWLDRVRRVQALPDDAILAAEPDWLAWLASQSALAAVREGLASPDPRERERAASLLWLVSDAAELRCNAADELAIGILRDPATHERAASYLLFCRANDLGPGDLASLRASPDPTTVLVGEALRARRGEPFDAARVREIWAGLSATQRIRSNSAAHYLRLE